MTSSDDDNNIWSCDLNYLEIESAKLGKKANSKQIEWFCSRSWQLIRDYGYDEKIARQQAFNEITWL
jgi:hypothetical protein